VESESAGQRDDRGETREKNADDIQHAHPRRDANQIGHLHGLMGRH
jgi:hypothetical protein